MDNFEIFILDLAKEYGDDLSNPSIRDQIVRSLSDRLMNRINRNIIMALPDHLIDKLYLLLEQGRMDESQPILNNSGIYQTAIIARTML